MLEAKVEVRHLGKRYQYLWALRDVSFSILKNQRVVGFVGHNGAGKSTLLQLIGLSINPTIGEVRLDGQKAGHLSEQTRATVSVVSYYSFLYDDLTGWENLRFWLKLYPKQVWKTSGQTLEGYIEAKSKEFGILDWLDRPVGELSTGMRKKVDFIRAFLVKPKLLLLDEPFSGMDPKNVSFLLEQIKSSREIETVLVASHNLHLIAQISDRVLCLHKGRVFQDFHSPDVTSELVSTALSEVSPN